MSILTMLHAFWGWAVAIFGVLAAGADAVKGFKWSKAVFRSWTSNMFGLKTFKEEINARFESTDNALKQNHELMQLIAKEMRPNGGSSLRDVVNKIDERQMLNSERVKALSTDSPVSVQEFNQDGELIWANRTFLRMVNRDLTEMLGYGWINSVYPDDRDRVKTEWQLSVSQGMAYESEYRVLRSSGEILNISVRTTVMRVGDRVLGYVTSVHKL